MFDIAGELFKVGCGERRCSLSLRGDEVTDYLGLLFCGKHVNKGLDPKDGALKID